MCLLNVKIVRYEHRDTAGHVTQVLYVPEVYNICWLNSVTQLLYRDKESASRKSACIYRETSIVVGSLLILKNLFMLSVLISSYGCTREVWRARKMRKSIHNSMYAQLKAWANSFIDRFHLTSRRPYWCTKQWKRRPCWCTEKHPLGIDTFLM